jgi:primosomal protein N' (replication factor Y)
VRIGVSRAREELEALAGEPVGEVTSDVDDVPSTRVLVGTEAVLRRVDRADTVAFIEIDQELLAPRYRAAEQAMALLARAGRIVGGRAGRLLLQTRVPRHDVIDAVLHADPGRLVEAELARRGRRLRGRSAAHHRAPGTRWWKVAPTSPRPPCPV